MAMLQCKAVFADKLKNILSTHCLNLATKLVINNILVLLEMNMEYNMVC